MRDFRLAPPKKTQKKKIALWNCIMTTVYSSWAAMPKRYLNCLLPNNSRLDNACNQFSLHVTKTLLDFQLDTTCKILHPEMEPTKHFSLSHGKFFGHLSRWMVVKWSLEFGKAFPWSIRSPNLTILKKHIGNKIPFSGLNAHFRSTFLHRSNALPYMRSTFTTSTVAFC